MRSGSWLANMPPPEVVMILLPLKEKTEARAEKPEWCILPADSGTAADGRGADAGCRMPKEEAWRMGWRGKGGRRDALPYYHRRGRLRH